MKNSFTPEQIKILEQNRYTKKVSPSVIKFTSDFKDDFWRLYLTDMTVRDIFRTLGYDPSILGEYYGAFCSSRPELEQHHSGQKSCSFRSMRHPCNFIKAASTVKMEGPGPGKWTLILRRL